MKKAASYLKNPYVVIIATYFAAHFFMLLLSGCWWDDWTFMTHDLNYINTVASESGRPEWNLLVPLCWSLPNNGRILIFFLHLLNSVFVYEMLKNSGLFDEKESLYITVLFTVIPVNDARILISNFAYNVGLFFFYLSFMLFVFWNKMQSSKKKVLFRILILALFYISFILNSLLAYYYILFVYLFVLQMKKNDGPAGFVLRILDSVWKVLKNYPDFFVLPFVYYGANKVLFPTYGDTFGNYNAITLTGLLNCFVYVPKSIIKIAIEIINRCFGALNVFTAVIILAVAAAILFQKNEKKDAGKRNMLKFILLFGFGMFVLAWGIFPYTEIRGDTIYSFGVKGRDAILVPLGASMVTHSIFSLFSGKIRRCLVTVAVLLGILGFNSLYVEWQKDYYYQLSMEHLFDNDVIRDNDTFFLAEVNETDIEAQRYYSLNMNAYNVFGDETRFFIPKVSNLYILRDEKALKEAKEALAFSHMMREYEPEDYCFDAVLNYSNDLSTSDVLKLKYYEMFDKGRFDTEINNNGSLDIYIVENDFTASLMKKLDKGELRNDEDVIDFTLEYVN